MNQEFLAKLETIFTKDNIKSDEMMSKHTTFRIGGKADIFLQPNKEQLSKLLPLAKEYSVPLTVIGNGSNLLVRDGGIRGVVVEIGRNMSEILINEAGTVFVEAGAMLSRIANEAAKNSLTGFEFAAGIPGTVGGAVVMNAGAYGGEMKDVLQSVTVLTEKGEERELLVGELDLSYRHSCIPAKNYIVVGAKLKLEAGNQEEIRGRMEELKSQRVEKQPLEFPSAGSTFKRPEGYYAGKLVSDAGLKGYAVGDAQVSEKHAGFVVNKGSATASQVEQLIAEVSRIVEEKFDVRLEPEVKIIGEK